MSYARARPREADESFDPVRERILQAFSARATRSGLRSVVMAELASELRMSATTLYKHFPSKEELVRNLVERWVMELAAAEAVTDERPEIRTPVDRVRHWAEVWSRSLSELSIAFIQDLQRDYPKAWRAFSEGMQERKRVGAALLRPLLKPELNAEVALEMLSMALARVADPRFADQMGTSRSDAIQTAVSVWAAGAVEPAGQRPTVRRARRNRKGGRG